MKVVGKKNNNYEITMKHLKKFNENILLESSPDVDFETKVMDTKAYTKLSSEIRIAIENFHEDLLHEIGYEEGDSDKDRAVNIAIQHACDQNYGW